MPTRKQRRRRLKDLRHEWEEVYVDSEGRELPPEEVEEIVPARAKADRKPKPAAKGGRQSGQRQPRGVQPASWRRVFKRAALFAPLMYVFIALLDRENSALVNLAVTAQLLLVFIPFSYLMDRLTYRLWQKRQAKLNG